MSLMLRILLTLGALGLLAVVIRKVKKLGLQIDDLVSWILFAASLIIFALFPNIAICLAGLIGFMSASNFVFLYVIAVLIFKVYTLTLKTSLLSEKVKALTQEVALVEFKRTQGAAAGAQGAAAGAQGADDAAPAAENPSASATSSTSHN